MRGLASSVRGFRRAAIAAAMLWLSAGIACAQETPAVAAWRAANERFGSAVQAGQTATLIPLAEEALRKAEQAFGRDDKSTLENIRYLADLHFGQGRYTVAAPLYERYLQGVGTVESPAINVATRTLAAVFNLATIYRSQGRFAQAEPLFERAIRGNTRWMGADHPDTLRLTSALVGVRLADPALAAKAVEQTRTLAAAIRKRRDALTAPGLANTVAQGQLGNSSYALFANCTVAQLRAARESANDLDAFGMFADAAWARAAREPDRRAALTAEAFAALQDAIVGSAGQAVERMAVRTAADRAGPGLGALVRARQGLDDRMNLRLEAEAVLCQAGRGPAPGRGADFERDRIEAAKAEADAQLRSLFPDYFSFASKSTLDIAATQALLAPEEAILLVVPTPFGTQIMAVSRTQLEWRRSAWDRGKVAASVRRLLWDMGQEVGVDADTTRRWMAEGGPGTPFARKTAHGLYRELVAPVESVLAGKRHVFIATSGALTSLPFGVLVTQQPVGGDGDPKALRATKWFADAHALAVIPSIRSLQLLRGAAPPAGDAPAAASFAGYGDPTLDGQPAARGRGRSGKSLAARAVFTRGAGGVADVTLLKSMARLPGTGAELQAMRAAIGAPAGSVHVKDQATERAVRAADLSQVRILAFATHGLMAGELTGASEPGLVFTPPATASAADDGYLTASEVTELKLDADWVILSACNTAAGDGAEGAPGLSGLARAFFYAGARHLLVSHWPVDDDVAARLTVDAIKRRQADPKLGRADALQQAMRAVRNNPAYDAVGHETWAHPQAWAPFSLVGDGAN